ncbi:MAG: methionyl-tRNA formyltransferase [Candidatus Omnitrophota bacterium]|nr:methionyl-tRNA formyltransferase [Candidatus Omnitrophota bacterium]
MKIIFFGSDIFALPALEKLVSSKEEICAVVTQTDKKKGRFLHFGFSAVKEFALPRNLEVIQPETLKDSNFVNRLKVFNPDLFVVVAYGKIIPKEILEIPKIFPLNIHGSLLPKYRGAAPINWALINGDTTTGVSIIKMNEFMDAGEIIAQESIKIEDSDTAITLRERLKILASELLIRTIESVKLNNFSLTIQDEANVTIAPKLKKPDGLINWHDEAIKIHNKVRGLVPWPGSFTYLKGKILKIHQTEIFYLKENANLAGCVIQVTPDAIIIAAGKDAVKVKQLQIESGKKIAAWEFILGHKITIGDKLG